MPNAVLPSGPVMRPPNAGRDVVRPLQRSPTVHALRRDPEPLTPSPCPVIVCRHCGLPDCVAHQPSTPREFRDPASKHCRHVQEANWASKHSVPAQLLHYCDEGALPEEDIAADQLRRYVGVRAAVTAVVGLLPVLEELALFPLLANCTFG